MKIYVAGKFEDRESIRALYVILRQHKHTITLDWTNHDHPESDKEQEEWAIADIEGVKQCDILIALFLRDYRYRGALIEVGVALGLGKPVIILGRNENSSTLLHHPLITKLDFITDWEGLANSEGGR